METKTLLNTIYTVTDSRRGWNNDRTIHSLTGPKGGLYTLVEFDGSFRILTDLANGRSRKWHDHDLGVVSETATGSVDAHDVVAPATEPANAPALRRALAKANAESQRWAEKRSTLPAGSSRAKVTTANARWMSACEVRDRVAQRLFNLTGEIA